MRDDQVQRYARHIRLQDVGGLGQTAIMVASARVALREAEPAAELVAATYLVAAGVGTLAVPSASDAQRTELVAHGPDTRVVGDGEGRDVALAATPSWWPGADGDAVARAYWRGAIAAVRWLTETIER